MASFFGPPPEDPLARGLSQFVQGLGKGVAADRQSRLGGQDTQAIVEFLTSQQPGFAGPQKAPGQFSSQLRTPGGRNAFLQLLQGQTETPGQQAQRSLIEKQTSQLGEVTPSQKADIESRKQLAQKSPLEIGQLLASTQKTIAETKRLEGVNPADFQIVNSADGPVMVNKRDGTKSSLGIPPELNMSVLKAREVVAIQDRAARGVPMEGDQERLNNLYANVSVNNPRPAPSGMYDNIDKAAAGARVAKKLLLAFKPGGAGGSSVGPIDAVRTYMETQLGLLVPEKQVFLQDTTKLFSALKALNGEARMSDADLKFLRPLIPKARQSEGAWIAALNNLHKDSASNLQLFVNRLDSNDFTMADENRAYYKSLFDINAPIDLPSQTSSGQPQRNQLTPVEESRRQELLRKQGQ